MKEKIGRGRGLGKIILMGEHSVVYGEPALALAFPAVKAESSFYRAKEGGLLKCIYHEGKIIEAPEILGGLVEVLDSLGQELGEDLSAFNLEIESSIPPERGMGSSAAVSVATIRSIYDYFDRELAEEELLHWVHISEKFIHGNPSGIDGLVTSLGRPVFYIKGQAFELLDLSLDAYLVVADTGVKGKTRQAVESVARSLEQDPKKGQAWIKELGQLARRAKDDLGKKDLVSLGNLMTRAHGILDQLGVSDHSLNSLVQLALSQGALGAKLTGGGRGGCMIALASSSQEAARISQALLENGADRTWLSDLSHNLD